MPPNLKMRDRRIKLVIIGGGILGRSLAHEAAKPEWGIKSAVLDNGQPGTTESATGIWDARADHLLRDVDSVEQTARAVIDWQNEFPYEPYVVKPKRFLMPVGPNTPHGSFAFDALLELYEKIAYLRCYRLPGKYQVVSASMAEQMEPNLRKNHFSSAFLFWLWTVDPFAFLRKIRNETTVFSEFSRTLYINKILGFKVRNSFVEEIAFEDHAGKKARIDGPMVIINTTGPWIEETLRCLGIRFPVELKLGVQAKFSGHYFQSDSGLITFGRDGKYVICLQKNGYLQVGPTNSPFLPFLGRLPSKLGTADYDLGYLEETLSDILKESYPVPTAEMLKYGWRVKPKYFIDTDRPVIWHHRKDGYNNLYSAVPGKMVLGLLTARELMTRLAHDGWLGETALLPKISLALDGKRPYRNQLKLLWLYLKSNLILAIHFIRKVLFG